MIRKIWTFVQKETFRHIFLKNKPSYAEFFSDNTKPNNFLPGLTLFCGFLMSASSMTKRTRCPLKNYADTIMTTQPPTVNFGRLLTDFKETVSRNKVVGSSSSSSCSSM